MLNVLFNSQPDHVVFFEPNLQRSLIQLDEDATASEKVKAILLENLPAGLCTIEDVAQRLAMSKRTLQRLLLEEQTNFKTLLDTTRQSLAQHYLEKSSMSTGEISFLLGFQEHNSFNRAFKTGRVILRKNIGLCINS